MTNLMVVTHGLLADAIKESSRMLDVEAANAHGVMVSNIPAFMEREDVAEHSMALTMDLAKRVAFSSAAVKNGEWATDRDRYLGYRLNGKTVGICGFDNIGAYNRECNRMMCTSVVEETFQRASYDS